MRTADLGIDGQVISVPAHIALFSETRAELVQHVAAYLRPALDDPHQGIIHVPYSDPARLLRDLERDLGRPLFGSGESGRVIVLEPSEDADLLLDHLQVALSRLAGLGMTLTRVFGSRDWQVRGSPHPEDFLWFESQLDRVLAPYSAIALCGYSLVDSPATTLTFGGLETHQWIYRAGRLNPSPRYLEANRFFVERLMNLPWLTPTR